MLECCGRWPLGESCGDVEVDPVGWKTLFGVRDEEDQVLWIRSLRFDVGDCCYRGDGLFQKSIDSTSSLSGEGSSVHGDD